MPSGLDAFIPQLPDWAWETIIGIILIIVALYFLWKYIDTGNLPSGKDFKFKF